MNNPYKLICLDLDGTLLNDDKKIDPITKEYLQELLNRDVYISIASGRTGYDARKHGLDVDERLFYIANNGAMAGLCKDDTSIFEKIMTDKTIQLLLEKGTEFGANPVFQTKHEMYVIGEEEYMRHKEFVVKNNEDFLQHMILVESVDEFQKIYKEKELKIQKAVYFIHDEEISKKAKVLLEHPCLELAITFEICYEVTEKGVNKSYGINHLCDYLNISKDAVIAFGDSENDMEMLKHVGLGVAMGNSDEVAKLAANQVTESNNNNGIEKFLRKVFH